MAQETQSIQPKIVPLNPLGLETDHRGAGSILAEVPIKKHDYVTSRYDRQSEGFTERLCYEAGVSYIIGSLSGGVYGAIHGYRNQNYPNWKLKMNAILNGGGKYASRTGNTLAVFALLYRLSRWNFKSLRNTNDEWNDIGAVAVAGSLSALPKGLSISALAGVALGCYASGLIYFKRHMEDYLD